jgi:hypothetical protein
MEPVSYVAVDRLAWGDGYIEAGQPVPDEEGRNYDGLLRLGKIARAPVALTDEQAAARIAEITAERDALKAKVAGLEQGEADEVPPVEVPDGVVPGETPGWPLVVLPFTDEQRELMAGAGVSGTFTTDALRAKLDELRAQADGADTPDGDDTKRSDASADARAGEDTLPDGVRDVGHGWFELPDGSKVRRKDIPARLPEAKA